ncbi:dihydrofolate reductase family protein [Chryseobacterium sp. ISL-6]|uniref:dihydrofolate reductase family protein n=1 Tax=Chryseobacterium sp. ISL-6 TaxID=2819143 RepID=UPI0025555995|nr:dihydrofolate reductase family protein [Chryseobacterium sp. ISL-6]
MRKLVLKMSVSADGFVCGPNGEIDWLLRTRDQSAFDWIEKTLWDAGVHIMGSRTFHDMVAYWPTSPDPLAVPMNEIPKVVFSKKGFVEQTRDELTTQAFKDSSRQDAEKGIVKTTISKSAGTWSEASIASDIVSDITKLKQQDGKFILAHGGASFAQDLVKHELIDEYRLVIHPVILGKGIPLFALAPNPIDLKLESSTHFDSGIIANIYSTIVK